MNHWRRDCRCPGRKADGEACRNRVATEDTLCGRCRQELARIVEEAGLDAAEVLDLLSDPSKMSHPLRMIVRMEPNSNFNDPSDDELAQLGNENPEVAALVQQAMAISEEALRPSTRDGYEDDWKKFEAFCKRLNVCSRPADPRYVMLYLVHLATRRRLDGRGDEPLAHTTIRRAACAIRERHMRARLADPTADPRVKRLLRGHANLRGVANKGKDPLLMPHIEAICANLDAAAKESLRDVALVLLAVDPALLLSAVDLAKIASWSQVDLPEDLTAPAVLHMGVGRHLAVEVAPNADPLICPVAALRRLRDACAASGPVFASLVRPDKQVSRQGITKVVRQHLRRAGLPMAWDPGLAPEDRRRLVAAITEASDIDLRDRPLLLNLFLGAARADELASRTVGDVALPDDGVKWHVDRAKNDPEGKGRTLFLPADRERPDLCPRRALQAWLCRLSALLGRPLSDDDYIFVTLDNRTWLSRRLDTDAVANVVRRRAEAAGIEGDFASHSLRSGFVTEAIEAGVASTKIADHGGWRNPDSLRIYYRRSGSFGPTNPVHDVRDATRPEPTEPAEIGDSGDDGDEAENDAGDSPDDEAA